MNQVISKSTLCFYYVLLQSNINSITKMIQQKIIRYYELLKKSKSTEQELTYLKLVYDDIQKHIRLFIRQLVDLPFFKSTQDAHQTMKFASTIRCFSVLEHNTNQYGCCFTQIKANTTEIELINVDANENITKRNIVCQEHFVIVFKSICILNSWDVYCQMLLLNNKTIELLLQTIHQAISFLKHVKLLLNNLKHN